MIVDLARNDLGRVARLRHGRGDASSARSSRIRVCTTWCPASRRACAPAYRSRTIVRATFPPGSVTGAPKIRALEIIEELEPVRRGPYCGAIGCFAPGRRHRPVGRDPHLCRRLAGACTCTSAARSWPTPTRRSSGGRRCTRRPACWRPPVARCGSASRSRSPLEGLARRRARRRAGGARVRLRPRLPGRGRRVRDAALSTRASRSRSTSIWRGSRRAPRRCASRAAASDLEAGRARRVAGERPERRAHADHRHQRRRAARPRAR